MTQNERGATGRPRGSVIINNYNYGRFLGEAIETAVAQTYQPTEVIVVDDGSTDNSRQVLANYRSRVRLVLKDNGGQASAYNAGFAASSGDVVCMLDADDTLSSAAIEAAVKCFASSDAVKVQWPLEITDASGRSTGKVSTTQKPPTGLLRDNVAAHGPIYDFHFHTGCAMQRWFLERVFPMPEAPYRHGADVYLTTLAPVYGRIETLPLPLGTYRAHGSNNYRDRQLTDERVQDYLRRFETNCDALATHLTGLGIAFDRQRWRRCNFNYLWPSRFLHAKEVLRRLLPQGSSYVLIDGYEWGDEEPLQDRHAIRLEDDERLYDKSCDSDVVAIEALERARKAGANFLVIWWTAYWWKSEHPRFWADLAERYRSINDTDTFVVYDLSGTISARNPQARLPNEC